LTHLTKPGQPSTQRRQKRDDDDDDDSGSEGDSENDNDSTSRGGEPSDSECPQWRRRVELKRRLDGEEGDDDEE